MENKIKKNKIKKNKIKKIDLIYLRFYINVK